MFKKILVSLFLVTVGALTAGLVSYAWTEPLDTPPNGNVSGLSGILQGGDLVIDGVVKAKDFLVTFLDASGKPASKSMSLYMDKDGDGYTPAQGDCGDNDAAIHPGAAPQYDSEKDYDCNGTAEYTTDLTTDVNTWYAGNACTKGGNLANFVGYITGYKYNQQNDSYDSNITNLYTMTNQKGKLLLCLNNNLNGYVYIGTSGNPGSCGGYSEQGMQSKKDGTELSGGSVISGSGKKQIIKTNKAVSGYWHIWCN